MRASLQRFVASALALSLAGVVGTGCASSSATPPTASSGPVASAPADPLQLPDPAAPDPAVSPGPSALDHVSSAVEGAVLGAIIGAQGGPLGAAIGAGALLIYGAITGDVPLQSSRRGGTGGYPSGEAQREETLEDQIDGELQKQASLEGEIEEELRRQEELLKKIESEQASKAPAAAPGAAVDPTAPTAPVTTDPRTAPAAPAVRSLDTELFDEKKATVAKGKWGDNDELEVIQRSLDADRDGKPEELRYFDEETSQLVRVELDRNYDGTIDAWTTYDKGVVVRRELDESGDGVADAFETYAGGMMAAREVDRDADGARDAFYAYQGDALVEERHDADDDGKVDLVIRYQGKTRVLTEEDQNHDGRTDVWTHYEKDASGNEVVARVERDKAGKGTPDTFESFGQQNGKTVLTRREEDANGDGKVDIISVYENGKLKSREVSDPTLVPL
jgi:hypothetical protein